MLVVAETVKLVAAAAGDEESVVETIFVPAGSASTTTLVEVPEVGGVRLRVVPLTLAPAPVPVAAAWVIVGWPGWLPKAVPCLSTTPTVKVDVPVALAVKVG